MSTPAILALEDGSIFKGTSIGTEGLSVGEMLFNTSMIGYQEIISSPSYANQIVTLTYPHAGSYGTNPEDDESANVHAKGLVIKDLSLVHSNFRSTQSLAEYLQQHNVVAIAGVDTRRLTRILREKGNLKGCVLAGENAHSEENIAKAIAAAKAFEGLTGIDLVKQVSTKEPYAWTQTDWQLGAGFGEVTEPKFKVVVYDYGVKRSVLRALASVGCAITVVPADTPAAEVLAQQPNGVFLSNGPGDPQACTYAVENIKALVEANVPVFGLGLGHLLLALALGGKTEKQKISNHGSNHPVKELATERTRTTTQDQSFAIAEASLPATVKVTHKSLFDGTVQGIELEGKPVFSQQGYCEAYPAADGMVKLFDQFASLLAANK